MNRNTEATRYLEEMPIQEGTSLREERFKQEEDSRQRDEAHNYTEPSEWINRSLRKPYTLSVLLLNLGIIAAVLTLERVSRTKSGIVEIPASASPVSSDVPLSRIVSSVGLLWTTLPSLIMILNRLAWDSVVWATADRQPYVELCKPRQAQINAEGSIMLDYRSCASLWGWATAFQRGHWALGSGMALNLILSIIVVPMSAYLLAPATVSIQVDVPLQITNAFNLSLLTAEIDMQPAIVAASALLVHGGIPPPWITAEYAFEKFSLNQETTKNTTAKIAAYSGYLDCELKSGSESSISRVGNTLYIDTNDRGCSVPTMRLPLNDDSDGTSMVETIYATTWSTQTCSNKAHISRLGLLAGGFTNGRSETHPLSWNVSILSCIPSMWKTYGFLTALTKTGLSTPQFFFEPELSNATELDPFDYMILSRSLPNFKVFDPTNKFYTDAFGRAVFEYARKRNSQFPLQAKTLIESMETVFTSTAAYLAGTTMFQPAEDARTVTGILSTQQSKLFVFTPVAYTIVTTLALVVFCNAYLIWYIEKYPSCLHEDPHGLLAIAALLGPGNGLKSLPGNLPNVISRFQGMHPGMYSVQSYARERDIWKQSLCYFDKDSQSIVMRDPDKLFPSA